MNDTVTNMVDYGGLDAVAKANPPHYYTNGFLAK